MTKQRSRWLSPFRSDWSFKRKLQAIQWVSYSLLLLPIATEFLERGRLPVQPRRWITEIVTIGLILFFILIIRRTCRELIKIEELKKNLTQLVIHDLKAPMASITGAVSYALDEPQDNELKKRLLNLALYSCRTQAGFIDTLLDIDRLESSQLQTHKKYVLLNEAVQNCLQDVQAAAHISGVTLRKVVDAAVQEVYADPSLLHRILVNILNNAIKFTPRGGLVVMAAGAESHNGKAQYIFQITDTGKGISTQHIDKIFQKFYRVDKKDQFIAGTGLGLYFCKLAVEAQAGTLRVRSTVGQGTTVTVSLPSPTPIKRQLSQTNDHQEVPHATQSQVSPQSAA